MKYIFVGNSEVEGIWEYLQHPFYVLDFVVIGVSILFEIAQLTGSASFVCRGFYFQESSSFHNIDS